MKQSHLLVFERGSRGPSTVTLIALLYVATCGGLVDTIIVKVKLLPKKLEKKNQDSFKKMLQLF